MRSAFTINAGHSCFSRKNVARSSKNEVLGVGSQEPQQTNIRFAQVFLAGLCCVQCNPCRMGRILLNRETKYACIIGGVNV